MIAFFGMGLLGSNFVRALRKRGVGVNVWNRSADKATALEADGARAFANPADAARGATRLHLTLSDDAVVDAVLAAAQPAAGQTIVDHSTVSPPGVLARIARWKERGVTYLHAPVFMGPQNARESTGLMMVSGPRELVDLGDRPDNATCFKLLGNLFLMCMTAGLADMLALGKQLGVAPADAATLFDHFNPGTTITARARRMIEAKYGEASWELAMARKDARLIVDAAAHAGVPLAVVPAIAARMDAVIAEGHGGDDWTVIAKDALAK